MPIDTIDFSKLKPYDGKVTKCFEQLCYQIAQKEYGHLGKFTPIDGSGGDGGVEFYLELNNGDIWGWQCKFFGDTGRLNIGNRKMQIAGSLETACRNRKKLQKWFLCLKTDLTANSKSAKGKITKGEQDWFDSELPKKVPAGRTVKLEHWGETSFIGFLKQPKHVGIRHFFFGELEFNQEWFDKRYTENFKKVEDKYDAELHSIDDHTQAIINSALFDPYYIKQLEMLESTLRGIAGDIKLGIKEFKNDRWTSDKEAVQRNNYAVNCEEFIEHIVHVFQNVELLKTIFLSFDEQGLKEFDFQYLSEEFYNKSKNIDYSVFEQESKTYRDASLIYDSICNFQEIYNSFFRAFFYHVQNELHFLGDAAKGKTHISCDIANSRIKRKMPAIFITGDKFSNESSITEAFRKNFDIPMQYSMDDFISALNVYGSIIQAKIPIVIDGLNETTFNGLFSPIWKNHLETFITKVKTAKNIFVITTCRSSYKNRIWDKTGWKKFHDLSGFHDYETIREAVTKYFNKYRLKADLFFAPIKKFEDPIFLKIYCEIKNPNWKKGTEVEVNIGEESSFDIFDEYLSQVNKRVTINSSLLRENEPFITDCLSTLASYLWTKNIREIPVKEFYKLIDGDGIYQKDNSKSDIIINEGLVVTRDMRDDQEYMSFTYQMMAGYIISRELIEKSKGLGVFTSSKFIKRIVNENEQHPMYDDIISATCLLLPQLKQTTFHELIKQDRRFGLTKSKYYTYVPKFLKSIFSDRIKFADYVYAESITSLFKLPHEYVKVEDSELVNSLFHSSDQNRNALIKLSVKTLSDIQHPLNALFLSKTLAQLNMNERDLSWTEYVRMNSYDLTTYVKEFESQCKDLKDGSTIITQKLHLLAHYVQWILTSTNRGLRDLATRALYFYGRKFPGEFATLVYESLGVNDPYVWERTLASLYGVTMGEHNSLISTNFKEKVLPEIVENLYQLMFQNNAQNSTTHILARDYARRTIEIGLIHHPDILELDEISKITPPYDSGGIRKWGEIDYVEKEHGYSGPIQMDFSNYTIGRIVKDGSSYADPPEKKKVRRQIYWRIDDLGWSVELFKDVEKAVGNDNYYGGRSKRENVERYGKKYSWIAYFEVAGFREDLKLLDDRRDWDEFRPSDVDIDPSFPNKPDNIKFITKDLLGDRKTTLAEWYEHGGSPELDEYLEMNGLDSGKNDWVCMDGFIVQEDLSIERERFTFIRGLLIKENDYKEVVSLLGKQNLGGRWLPEKRENYYTFAGELYYCPESTYDNLTRLEFVIDTKIIKIKYGDPGYYPSVFYEKRDNDMELEQDFPEEIEREEFVMNDFEILLPVKEYNWESHHSELNEAGQQTVISKEIATHLELIDQPQTFDLYDQAGARASINVRYHENYNNNHNLVYLRKDLLDKFLIDNQYRLIWAVWGEREVKFPTDKKRDEFYKENPLKELQVFQKIVEYS